MMRLALVFALAFGGVARADSSAPVAAPPADLRAFWPDVSAARFLVEIKGQLDARGRFDVNLINGPPTGGPREPPPLAVPHLRAMNADLHGAVEDTLRALGLNFLFSTQPPSRITQLTVEPAGDVYFALAIEIGPGNGLGGHYAGTDVDARVRSWHRREEIHTWGFAPVALVPDEKQQLAEVRAAVRKAVVGALSDFRATVAKPLVQIELEFSIANLGAPQRDYVRDVLAACAIAKANPVRAAPMPADQSRRVAYALWLRRGRWEPQSADQLYDWYAAQLPSIASGKGEGCLFSGPLDDWRVTVTREPPRTIVVSFSRP